MSEETKRVRSPRFLQPDSLVRPYVRDDAEGHKILGVSLRILRLKTNFLLNFNQYENGFFFSGT